MKVHTATLAGGSSNADRVFVTDHAVIVLDGATAFAPVDVDPGQYAATLGEVIAAQLDSDPLRDLVAVVGDAIAHTSNTMHLSAGQSPSSTVTILRKQSGAVDLYALGDSLIFYGIGVSAKTLTDDRLSALQLPQRDEYRRKLIAGAGYTNEHRATLAALQRAQVPHRNRHGGYWIAETCSEAAQHAVTATIPASHITWAVLATDGAADAIDHRGQPSWHEVAQQNAEQLLALLTCIHGWESTNDPQGQLLPRPKRHDDKTIAAISSLW